MQSLVYRNGELTLDSFAEPKPDAYQILVQTIACGICGSDLHFVEHSEELADQVQLVSNYGEIPGGTINLEQDIFMGHEFSAKILEIGADADVVQGQKVKPGDTLVSLPVLISGSKISQLAYSNDCYGGFAQQLLVSNSFCFKVPEDLDSILASLTEPMAVGLHAVNLSKCDSDTPVLVLGLGPVGISIIAALKNRNVNKIVGVDFSQFRRDLAILFGADVALDPSKDDVFAEFKKYVSFKRPVIFEAVGLPGILNDVMLKSPLNSKVVVVGVCMQNDSIVPFYGIAKELEVVFSFAYNFNEFKDSLYSLIPIQDHLRKLVTSEFLIDNATEAFELLKSQAQNNTAQNNNVRAQIPDNKQAEQCKVLIRFS